MDGQPSVAPETTRKPSLRTILKESSATASDFTQKTREVTGRPRQVAVGAMLGACLAFLLSILGVQRLDTPLTVGVCAFAAAMPFLIVDLLIASLEFKPELPVAMVNALKVAGFLLCEIMGGLGLAVGVVAVLWHLSGAAVVAMALGLVGALLTPTAVLVVVIVWLALRYRKARAAGRDVDVDDIVRESGFFSRFESDPAESTQLTAEH